MQNPLNAYTHHQQQALNPQDHNGDSRDTDMRALLKCASRLKEALDLGEQNMPFYQDAIRYNQKLWTLFQVALTEPDNALPTNLKLQLLNVSNYIDRTSFQAITKFDPRLINSLIDLNKTIAKGLAQKPQNAQQAPITLEQPKAAEAVMVSA